MPHECCSNFEKVLEKTIQRIWCKKNLGQQIHTLPRVYFLSNKNFLIMSSWPPPLFQILDLPLLFD